MKILRKIFIAILLLSVGAVGDFYLFYPGIPKCMDIKQYPKQQGWTTCASNADCTAVQGYCAWEAVNIKNIADMELLLTDKYGPNRFERNCPKTLKDTPQPVAQCVRRFITRHCVIPKVTH